MQLPEAITERFPFLEPLEEPWAPMPRVALMAWVIFYVFVRIELVNHGCFRGLMDGVFVPIHEGGHLIFRVFGEFLCVAGGTFMQLFVPFALACLSRGDVRRRASRSVCFLCSSNFFRLLRTWRTRAGWICRCHGGRRGVRDSRLGLFVRAFSRAAVRHDDCVGDAHDGLARDAGRVFVVECGED